MTYNVVPSCHAFNLQSTSPDTLQVRQSPLTRSTTTLFVTSFGPFTPLSTSGRVGLQQRGVDCVQSFCGTHCSLLGLLHSAAHAMTSSQRDEGTFPCYMLAGGGGWVVTNSSSTRQNDGNKEKRFNAQVRVGSLEACGASIHGEMAYVRVEWKAAYLPQTVPTQCRVDVA